MKINRIFDKLRRPDKNKKNPIAYIFFALVFAMIIFAFVFMDPGMMGGGGPGMGGSGSAAKVGSSVVPIADYRSRLQSLRQRYSYVLNSGNAQMSEMYRRMIEKQALSQLVNVAVLSELKNEEGLIIPDNQVSNFILDLDFLQENGRFQRSKYETFLANTGRSPKAFENDIRRDLRLDLARSLFESAFKTSKAETDLESQIKDLRIKIDYIPIASADMQKNLKVSQAEIEKFMAQEKNKAKMKETYKKNGMKYFEDQKVKARLILILSEDSQPASFKKAKEKMDKISDGLNTKNFATRAKENSDDPTASEGGDLGYVVKGTYTPQWDQVAFSTPKGKISKAFKTKVGWAKLFIEEKTPAKKQSFASVKEQVARQTYTKIQAEKLLKEIKKMAQNNSKNLDSFLQEKALNWETTPELRLGSQKIPDIGTSEKIMSAVLSLKQDGKVYSKLIPVNGKNYLVRRNEIREASTKEKPQRPEMLGRGRMSFAFSKWLEEKRESLPIEINPALQKEQKGPVSM